MRSTIGAVLLALSLTACGDSATCASGRCLPPPVCEPGETQRCEAVSCVHLVDECTWETANLTSERTCDDLGQWEQCPCPTLESTTYPLGCPCTVEGERWCNGAVCSGGELVLGGTCDSVGCLLPCLTPATDAGP